MAHSFFGPLGIKAGNPIGGGFHAYSQRASFFGHSLFFSPNVCEALAKLGGPQKGNLNLHELLAKHRFIVQNITIIGLSRKPLRE